MRSCGAFLSPASPCSFSFSQSESDFSYMSRWCHLDFFPSGVKLLSVPFCGEGVLSRWGVRPLTTWSLCELSALSDRADCLFSSRISLVLLHEPSEFFQVFFLTFKTFFTTPNTYGVLVTLVLVARVRSVFASFASLRSCIAVTTIMGKELARWFACVHCALQLLLGWLLGHSVTSCPCLC